MPDVDIGRWLASRLNGVDKVCPERSQIVSVFFVVEGGIFVNLFSFAA